jgi:ribosomal protein L12E/L44/L45/RPP1/RPP2
VLDPARVEALVSRLSDKDRQRAIEGLALLAQAAEEAMRAGSRTLEGDSEVKKEA